MMSSLQPADNRVPDGVNHIHLMGICGTGMAALAGMLQQSGYMVTGSDAHVYPPMSTFLEGLHIPVLEGYSETNLIPAPDLVIVGNVITRTNPEAQALAALKLPYLSFPQALAHFFIQQRKSLVIAGTHGKTTTCSLLATSLFHSGLQPSFMIGGIVGEFGTNFRLDNGPYFVAEGDEYDTAFFDKESKFLHYRPDIAVITSIEFDHADIFADLDAIKRSFTKFVRLLPSDGLLIANLEDSNVAEIAAHASCPVQSYGTGTDMTWRADEIIVDSDGTECVVYKDNSFFSRLRIPLPGRHNCLNSLATIAVMDRLDVARDTIVAGLARFQGVKRRQEVRGVVRNITVIDDFAHHPTAVRETLAALKASYKDRRLVAVFEPRTNSSRRGVFQKAYVHSFDAADLVLIREPVPLANVAASDLFSAQQLAADLTSTQKRPAAAYATTEAILEELEHQLQPGDVVAILSNGGFDDIHRRLLAALR